MGIDESSPKKSSTIRFTLMFFFLASTYLLMILNTAMSEIFIPVSDAAIFLTVSSSAAAAGAKLI